MHVYEIDIGNEYVEIKGNQPYYHSVDYPYSFLIMFRKKTVSQHEY